MKTTTNLTIDSTEEEMINYIAWPDYMVWRCEETNEMIKFYMKNIKKLNDFAELNVLFDNQLEDKFWHWLENYYLWNKADNWNDYYDIYPCNDWYVLYAYDSVYFIPSNTVEDFEDVEMTQEEIESFVL